MKRRRLGDEPIVAVLKENEAGARVDDLCRRHGISGATFHAWRAPRRGGGRCPGPPPGAVREPYRL